jgi:hypothetical protein
VLIAVDAPNGCLTAPAFFERVRRRTTRLREATPGEPARRFSLTIEEKERVSGKLLTENTDGTTALREVEGASCQEVADALALVVAVTLDPLADLSSASDENPPPLPRSSPAPGAPTPWPPPRAPSPASRPKPRPHFQHELAAEATLAAGLVDAPLPGIGVRYFASWGPIGSGLLLTVGAFATLAGDTQANYASGGVVRYRLQAFNPGVCPVGARVGARLGVSACATLILGRLEAQGMELPGGRSDASFFMAAGLEGRGELHLTGPLGLIAAAGLSAPIGEYSAEVAGAEEPVDHTNPVGFVGALGLVVSVF